MTAGGRRFSLLERYSTEATLAAILVVFFVVLTVSTPYFFTQENLANLVKQAAINGIIALGTTIVIISGGIDLSVGSVAALSGVVSAMLMVGGVPIILSCAAGLLAATVVGVINAVMIFEGDIPPFIATLATMTMARGMVKVVTEARTVTGLPDDFLSFGAATLSLRAVAILGVDRISGDPDRHADPHAVRAQRLCNRLQPGSGAAERHQSAHQPLHGLRARRADGGHRRRSC